VPTPTVSVVDFTAILNKEASPAEINAVMKKAAEGPLKGILRYTDKELVSSDLKGDPHSSIFSAVDTIGLGNFVKVVQRVPVKIKLEPGQDGLDRLRIGMSATVTVKLQ
jgi:glyceraldehyde 3-phosphate dehydrogenase